MTRQTWLYGDLPVLMAWCAVHTIPLVYKVLQYA